MRSSLAPLLLALGAASTWASGARADYIDHFANREDIGLLKVPHTGETRVLVIPVLVDDQPYEQGSDGAFLDEIDRFFDPEAEGFAFTPYWVTQSLGRFRPVATVAPPVHFNTCPPLGEYENCDIPRGAGLSGGNLQGAAATLRASLFFLDEILRCAQEAPVSDRSCTISGCLELTQIDTSGQSQGVPDGFVDGVIVISNAGFPGIALPVQELSENALMRLLGSTPSFVYGGTTVPSVAIAGHVSPPQRDVWLSVHEFGHLLGFADLYDETGQTTDLPCTVMGGWYYGTPAPLLDPFSRLAIGFAHAIQVSGSGTYELSPVDTSGTVLKVGTGEEFFAVELRRKISGVLDEDLQVDAAVVVERVRLAKRPSPERGNYLGTLQNCVNCEPYNAFLSLEQADGLFQLERGLSRNDEDDLFLAGDEIGPSDDTEPRTATHAVFSTNLTDGTPTGITLRVVAVSAEGATVEIEAPEVADACAELEPYCGGLPCENGECGRVLPVEEPPPECEGCCCSSLAGAMPWSLALFGLAIARRRSSARRACLAKRPLPSVE